MRGNLPKEFVRREGLLYVRCLAAVTDTSVKGGVPDGNGALETGEDAYRKIFPSGPTDQQEEKRSA